MKTEIRSQGEIIHLLTQDGFIQIYIQSVDQRTGQVRLGVVAPGNVRVVSPEQGNGLERLEILKMLNLAEAI